MEAGSAAFRSRRGIRPPGRRHRALATAVALWAVLAAPSSAAPRRPPPNRKAPPLKSLRILPGEVALGGPAARQLLVVLGNYADGSTRDLSRQARYGAQRAPGRPGIVAVTRDGLLKAQRYGATVVTATLGDLSARVRVTVAGGEAPRIRFARDVVPVLTQAGCNALSCHGSPTGRAGFKLSMYGFDPPADIAAIAKQRRTVAEGGLRVDLAAPEKSLVLLKPTLQVAHQGGLRFRAGSAPYRTLLAWLRAGAPEDPDPRAAAVERLEALPGERVFPSHASDRWRRGNPGQEQRLVVMAHYADGSREDVTHKTVYSSNDDAVATVDRGQVRATGAGETAVLVRYLGRVGQALFVVPKARLPASAYARFRPVNFIDRLAMAKWKKIGTAPADLCTDAEFLRRVSIDLTGTTPTPEEARAFLADKAPDKRARRIEELLARPAYVDWWSLYWGDSLRNNGRLLQPQGAKNYYDWIRRSVAENKPYDQFARELIAASGRSSQNGAVQFYRVARTPGDRGEQVAQLFLGVRLQCANCHNHPFEKWTRDQFHQFAALFARLSVRNQGTESEVASLPSGEYRHPETGRAYSPALLADRPIEIPSIRDRREVLADWLTGTGPAEAGAPASSPNPLFARNIANRLWAQLLGRGLVEPVDDVRATNPPVNEPLLDALARDLVAHRYDLKHLLRTIASSRTYQLSTRATRWNARDRQNFSRAYFRRLKAEALLDAICQATNQPENFNGYPAGTRAIQLVDNRVASYFMDIFGRPRREIVCACEREESANLTQALHLINGETLNRKIASTTGRVAELLRSEKANAQIVEELYLWTLSRPPTREETGEAVAAIGAVPNRREGVEDRLWVLLNSREFLFNH